MEMPGIQAQDLSSRQSIAEIKLVRTDYVALGADAKEFGLHSIPILTGVNLFSEHSIERLPEPLARPVSIHRRILETVGNPNVGNARRTQGAPKGRADA